MTEPCENVTHAIYDRSNGTMLCPDEVNVVGISKGLGKVQLVERCTAAKTKLLGEELITEQIDDGPADDEVLLDLALLSPGCNLAPGRYVHDRDHESGSGGRRTMMCQRGSRSLTSGAKSGSAACAGSSSTHGSAAPPINCSQSKPTCSTWPNRSRR